VRQGRRRGLAAAGALALLLAGAASASDEPEAPPDEVTIRLDDPDANACIDIVAARGGGAGLVLVRSDVSEADTLVTVRSDGGQFWRCRVREGRVVGLARGPGLNRSP
jgi:hypothetical protein